MVQEIEDLGYSIIDSMVPFTHQRHHTTFEDWLLEYYACGVVRANTIPFEQLVPPPSIVYTYMPPGHMATNFTGRRFMLSRVHTYRNHWGKQSLLLLTYHAWWHSEQLDLIPLHQQDSSPHTGRNLSWLLWHCVESVLQCWSLWYDHYPRVRTTLHRLLHL